MGKTGGERGSKISKLWSVIVVFKHEKNDYYI